MNTSTAPSAAAVTDDDQSVVGVISAVLEATAVQVFTLFSRFSVIFE
jgi:hypothetical protein